MNTQTKDFADDIGRRKIASAVGVGPTAVSNAVVAGRLPASWYDIIEQICLADGKECPRSLFSFKHPPAEASQ